MLLPPQNLLTRGSSVHPAKDSLYWFCKEQGGLFGCIQHNGQVAWGIPKSAKQGVSGMKRISTILDRTWYATTSLELPSNRVSFFEPQHLCEKQNRFAKSSSYGGFIAMEPIVLENDNQIHLWCSSWIKHDCWSGGLSQLPASFPGSALDLPLFSCSETKMFSTSTYCLYTVGNTVLLLF